MATGAPEGEEAATAKGRRGTRVNSSMLPPVHPNAAKLRLGDDGNALFLSEVSGRNGEEDVSLDMGEISSISESQSVDA